eukprot:CAMPEP_0201874444 /NCGR_PEP_ID=MMETSP0902-20130614/6697_1 /ASSEMBLY_ACC=CAM_ASM_000551 /TAXON_ID=420261 /ORGANISM="Thalassiosira antarctica, Strain CCMP982" /LENGTH=275 /DNA_ID=CAMNT_0048401317 /DNA_START=86 /DNA_END=910 /DNA_ORIENTATION=+
MVHRIAVAALLASSSAATAFMTEPIRTVAPTHMHLHHFHSIGRMRSIQCAAASSPASDAEQSIDIPSFVVSPVLAQVYPALLSHKAKYGNPNIPLGSTDGKRCKTLRRMHFQKKLSDEEAAHLTELGFLFHAFEDVYYECDFDEMLGKLIAYRDKFETYQIPKKYEPDPELGAWVTMLRRLHGTNDVPQIQIDKLDAVGFEWISSRKCGSVFMAKYRETLSYLSQVVEAGGNVRELLHEDTDIIKWIDAQRLVHENGNLSDSRIQYMDDLPGIDW